MCSAAMFFALFKTYGIPSVSRLLVSTGHFTHGLKAASRRAADTSVLICNMVGAAPASERAADVTARINYLHGPYRRAGRISNQDMLYTLSLFALEGIRWIDRYEWRRLTDLERCAMAIFWKAKGEDPGVNYDLLPSHERGWPDGLAWLEELDAWSRRYEAEHMTPSDENALLADAAMEMVLFKIPGRLKAVGRSFASVLLGQNLRDAMRSVAQNIQARGGCHSSRLSANRSNCQSQDPTPATPPRNDSELCRRRAQVPHPPPLLAAPLRQTASTDRREA